MIYVTKEKLRRYMGISQNLDTALRCICEQDLGALHNGRNELDGDEVFINVLEYDAIPEQQGAWEAHALYADVHVLLCGSERIGVSDIDRLKRTCFRQEEDFIGCEGGVDVWLPMDENTVLVVFPEDAHMVKIQNDGPSHVRRAVFKVRV